MPPRKPSRAKLDEKQTDPLTEIVKSLTATPRVAAQRHVVGKVRESGAVDIDFSKTILEATETTLDGTRRKVRRTTSNVRIGLSDFGLRELTTTIRSWIDSVISRWK